jgi:signal transduction histidine kinase
MLTRWLCLLMLLAPGLAQAGAQVAGYEIETAVYRDLGRELTIDTADEAHFVPASASMGLGFDAPVTWLRLTLRKRAPVVPEPGAGQDAGQPLVWVVGPYQLDKLHFYERVEGQWTAKIAGDRQPKNTVLCQSDQYCFAVDPRGNDLTTVYLKVETTGFPLLTTKLIPASALAAATAERAALIASSLTVSLTLWVIGLMLLKLKPALTLQAYCVHQLIVAVLMAVGSGVLSIPAGSPVTTDAVINGLIVLRTASILTMGWLVLARYERSALHKSLFIGAMALLALALLLLIADQSRLALQLNFCLQIATPITVLHRLMMTSQAPSALRNALLLGCVAYVALLIPGCLVIWGWDVMVPIELGPLDWRLSGGPIGFFIIWLMLDENNRRVADKASKYLKIEIEQARLRAEAERHSERRAMIEMLTHELKTPLSTIRFAMSSLSRLFHQHAPAHSEDGQTFMRRVSRIEGSVERMEAMNLQLAQAHKVEHLVVSGVPETMAARSLIEDLIQPYASTHRFELDIKPGLLLRSDRLMLTTLIENLVSNACKYSVDQRVSLSARCDPPAQGAGAGVARIAVANRVAAGAEPDETRLFARYYRHPAVSALPGTGMGLHIARLAAGKIGAALRYSAADSVVTFEVSLPC